MKLGKKLSVIKPLIILIFMFFICFKTIDYLYKNNDITNEEYIKLLLSDSYKTKDNNFGTNLIELFSKIFNPKDMLILDTNNYLEDNYNYEELRVHSKPMRDPNKIDNVNPLVYLYNTHQLEDYSKNGIYAYNITPNVMMTSYLLKEKLKEFNIESVVFDEFIYDSKDFFETSRKNLIDYKNKYPSIKYYFDIHRSNILKNISTIEIGGLEYARIYFIVGLDNKDYEKNYELAKSLNSKLNEKYPGISRGIDKRKFNLNQDVSSNAILIEFGGVENTINEIMNTIDVFSIIFNERLGE